MSHSKAKLAPPGDVLTLTEAATYMRVSTRTVHRWADAGKIKTYRLKDVGGNNNRRYLRSELLALLEEEIGHRLPPASVPAGMLPGTATAPEAAVREDASGAVLSPTRRQGTR